MADPVTIAYGAATALPIIWGLGKAIKDKIVARRKAKKAKKAGIGKDSPIVFESDELKLLDTLGPEQRKYAETMLGYANFDPDGFLGKLEDVDFSNMEALANQPLPEFSMQSPEQLGFPQQRDYYSELAQGAEFEPIAQEARRGYLEETVPGIMERFAGMGALQSSGLQGALAKSGQNLEQKLAALGSKHQLERAKTFGDLGIRQEAVGTQRALAGGELGAKLGGLAADYGLRGRQQQFGELRDLANLGMQERQQELQRRGISSGVFGQALAASPYQTVIPNQSNFAQQMIGTGMQAGGDFFKNYLQNQKLDSINQQLSKLAFK